jgi:hypothetical protein
MCRSIVYGKFQLRIRERHLNFVSNHKLIKRQNRDGCVRFFFSCFFTEIQKLRINFVQHVARIARNIIIHKVIVKNAEG